MGAPSTTVRSSAATDVTIGLGKTATPFDVTASPFSGLGERQPDQHGRARLQGDAADDRAAVDGQADQQRHADDDHRRDEHRHQHRRRDGGLVQQRGDHAKFGQGGLINSGTISAPDGHVNIELDKGPIDNSGTISANGYVDLEINTGAGNITNSGTVTSATSEHLRVRGRRRRHQQRLDDRRRLRVPRSQLDPRGQPAQRDQQRQADLDERATCRCCRITAA